MGHHSLWQCGASYLIHCPIQGLARLEILLQSLPMVSEARVNKIMDIAQDNNMDHVGWYNLLSVSPIRPAKSLKNSFSF